MDEKKQKKEQAEKKPEKEIKNPLTEENEALKKEVEDLKSQANDFKDKWMRNVAEFDNYKKRNAKLWQDAFTEGVSGTVTKILPIGDSLDRALSMGLDEKIAEGIKGLVKKFKEVLSSMGIEEINPEGEPFDPNFAEAVMQVEAGENEKSDCVKQVFEKGYKYGDKVIRYAKVSVIK